eukprot:gene10315-12027_t
MGKKKKSSSTTTTTTNGAPEHTVEDKGPFNPLADLDDKQMNIFNQFKAKLAELELDEQEKKWLSVDCDMMVLRYLRAREYDLHLAFELFKGTMAWRKSYKPFDITPESLAHEASTGKQYVHGKTLDGRPSIYMRPVLENTKNFEKQIQLVVYTLERAVEMMEASKGVEQIVLMIDFKDYSVFNAPPMSQSKQTLDILGNHFPERLGIAFLIDPPYVFNIFWNLIIPFVNKNTAKKVVFVKGDKAKQKILLQHFAPEQLEACFGGSSDFTFNRAFWTQEIQGDREKRGQQPFTAEELDKVFERKE